MAARTAAASAAIAASAATQIHQLERPLLRGAVALGRVVAGFAGLWLRGVESSGNACQSF